MTSEPPRTPPGLTAGLACTPAVDSCSAAPSDAGPSSAADPAAAR